ncbi:hypothetical protein Celaphus_00012124 [Cervus elaphus hippelaphus]|uniref:Uncharacterized protein n=1 Tax=Cervus elaphus hippelaphus TaxID=46360 RepID=A0A212CKC1_CEREH|nr:hypothetical protein Celaphus_00012124 [Cervus elaphus hippelaphus]
MTTRKIYTFAKQRCRIFSETRCMNLKWLEEYQAGEGTRRSGTPEAQSGRRRILGKRHAALGTDRILTPNSAAATASSSLPERLTSAPSAPGRGGPRSSRQQCRFPGGLPGL